MSPGCTLSFDGIICKKDMSDMWWFQELRSFETNWVIDYLTIWPSDVPGRNWKNVIIRVVDITLVVFMPGVVTLTSVGGRIGGGSVDEHIGMNLSKIFMLRLKQCLNFVFYQILQHLQ